MKTIIQNNDFKFYSRKFLLDEHTFDILLISLKNLVANSYLVKCICNDSDEIEYSKCVNLILDELIIKNDLQYNSYYNFLATSIKNFHNTHICSTKSTTLFSILLWKNLKAVCDCNSHSTKTIIKHLRVVLEECIDFVKLNFIKKLPSKSKKWKETKIMSRYLSSEKNLNLNINENAELYKKIITGISRNQTRVAQLLFDLVLKLNEANVNFNFDHILITSQATSTTKIKHKINHLSNNSNSEEFYYEIMKGIVVQVDDRDINFEILSKLNELEIVNCLFFESSLTSDYVHLGYNKSLKTDFIVSVDLFEYNKQESYYTKWRKMFEDIVISNNIKLIFVRDDVDKNLKEFLNSNSIICISKLEWSIVNCLKNDFRCLPFCYVEQFSIEKIFKCKLNFISDKNSYMKFNYLNIQHFDDEKYTILIETRLNSQTMMHKEYLRHCLKRLHNILNNNGEYLIGSGFVENKVALSLTDDLAAIESFKPQTEDEKMCYYMVKEIYSKTYRNYYESVFSNCIRTKFYKDEPDYFDDCISKFESWRTACIINQTLLNSDYSFNC